MATTEGTPTDAGRGRVLWRAARRRAASAAGSAATWPGSRPSGADVRRTTTSLWRWSVDRPRRLLAVDLGPLRPRLGHAGRARRSPTPTCRAPAGSPGRGQLRGARPAGGPLGPALVGLSQSAGAGRAEHGRAARPGGALPRRARRARRGPGRPGGGLPAQRPRGGGGPPGHRQPGGGLVVVRPRVRHPQRGRPAAPDRAGRAARRRRLPLRGQGGRPGRRGGRHPRRAAVAAGHVVTVRYLDAGGRGSRTR